MSDNRYNGWTNYETWAVKLWIDNDQGSQEYWLEQAQDACQRHEDEDDRVSELADAIEAQHDEYASELLKDASVFSDLLRSSLGSVDWREIAVSLIEDAAEILS